MNLKNIRRDLFWRLKEEKRGFEKVNLDDLAFLLGKTKTEVENLLKKNDVIELNLNERNKTKTKETGEIKIME